MRSLELLARMGAKGNNINGGGGGKAHSTLSDSDVAGALAGVSHRIGSLLLRAKYNLEPVGELRRRWTELVLREAADLKWTARKPERFTMLADAVLQETVCRNFEDCGSSSQRFRADAIGLSLSSYQELWHERYEHCMSLISQIETDAQDQYARHLKRR